MKIEILKVEGIEQALYAMRNPHSSHDNKLTDDYTLSRQLSKAGAEHSKHLRLIQVWLDITAPRFFWTEFDTYKHVEKISTSTMHSLSKKHLTQDDFELPINAEYLKLLNTMIDDYHNPRISIDIEYIKNSLPEGYLQRRTCVTNYQQLLNIYNQRKNHKLPQWRIFCDEILYLKEFHNLIKIV